MVKKIIKTNPNLIELINKLNKKSKTENEGLTEELQKLIYQILQGMQMLMKLF